METIVMKDSREEKHTIQICFVGNVGGYFGGMVMKQLQGLIKEQINVGPR